VDALALLGLLAVVAMLVFYALEERRPWFIVAFAGACAPSSVYGFLQGARPFGVVEAVVVEDAPGRQERESITGEFR
jgi:hypothetical protein